MGATQSNKVDGERQVVEWGAVLRQLETIVESSGDAICSESLDGTIESWNPAAERLLGYSAEEMIGTPICRLIPDELSNDFAEMIERLRRDKRIEAFETVRLHKDGRHIGVALTVTPITDEEGHVIGATQIARDLTERKGLEASLRLRQQVLDEVAQGIIFTDPRQLDNPITYVNPAFEQITGYRAVDVLGKNCRLLYGPGTDPAAVTEIQRALEECRPCAVELLNYRAEGTSFWNLVSIAPLHDDKGQVTHFVWVQTDVSQRRMLEEQVRQSQKMEAIGRLAGGVAHDFNNILTIILGNAEFALGELPPENTLLIDQVQTIVEAANRAAALTKQLLAFSRKQLLEPTLLKLNSIVANLERMLRALIGEDVSLITDLGPDLWQTKADPSQIEQIIMNLAVNARDAMQQGGYLRIATRNTQVDSAYVSRHPGVRPGCYVCMSVSDSGCGIPPALLHQVFEPFFTTKQLGEGTGMGLATVFGIVTQSNGHITVESEVGHGTTFHVFLPRGEETSVPGAATSAALSACGGAETLLLVEDEADVRRLARHILQAAGYRVLEASNGAEALDLVAKYPDPIDLLIADVVMPGMSGKQVADRLREPRPETKVLYMSGYPNSAVMPNGRLEQDAAFLQKPFTRASLTQQVRQAIDR